MSPQRTGANAQGHGIGVQGVHFVSVNRDCAVERYFGRSALHLTSDSRVAAILELHLGVKSTSP